MCKGAEGANGFVNFLNALCLQPVLFSPISTLHIRRGRINCLATE